MDASPQRALKSSLTFGKRFILRDAESLPMVAILMGTYNGAQYLAEQLDSLEKQVGCDWRLYVSDDGSSDGTLEILRLYQDRLGKEKIQVRHGPKRGYAINFLTLAADSLITADFYAFCDQDDVWLPAKLEAAVALLRESKTLPMLYGGRTHYADSQLKPYGLSPCFSFPPTFRNALVQSIAGGNTMVFNHKAKELIEKSGPQKIVSHDWWLYQLVSGCGGIVIYDPKPHILYRQHDRSIVGENSSMRARIKRVVKLFQGRFRDWNSANYRGLEKCRHLLSSEAVQILDIVEKLRDANLKDRIRLVDVAGLYRQTWQGTISLYIATLFNKL